jgi:voltage-gated potassium channel
MNLQKRVWPVLLAAVITFVAGIVGYEVIEGWSLLDATYMTVITLATIGYGETHPLSDTGRVFTMFLIGGGLTTVSYGALTFTALFADGELFRILRRKRMDKAIARLQNHYIVCGADRTADHVVLELAQAARRIVVIDKHPDALQKFHSREETEAHFGAVFPQTEVFYIEGDAASDHILLEAGIERADGIFCALESDKDNLFVVLTARGLNPRVRIVSKCDDDESEQKLVRAGADRVVSPTRIGGLRMASEMIRPAVVSFLDIMVRDPQGYRFQEIEVRDRSPFLGRPIRETPVALEPTVRVVAMASGNDYTYSPTGETQLVAGQRLVVLGRPEQVERLNRALNPVL